MDSFEPDQPAPTQAQVAEVVSLAVEWAGSAPATEKSESVTGFEGLAGSSANWKSHSWRISSVAAQRSFEIESCKQIAAVAAAAEWSEASGGSES